MNKRSKTLIIIILAIAGVLGLSALGIAYYYSQIEDVTPGDTQAEVEENKCNSIYVLNNANEVIPPEVSIDPTQPVTIGAEFQAAVNPDDPTTGLSDFRFVINSTEEIDVTSGEYESEQINDALTLYKPEASFSEFGTSNTLSIQAFAVAEGEIIELVPGCTAIYDVTQEANVPEPGSCLAAGETGDSSNDEALACCEGLTSVNECPEPDNDNQCSLVVEDCFICVAVGDKLCDADAGENFCNSPDDCGAPAEEPEDPEEPEEPTDEPEEPDEEPSEEPEEPEEPDEEPSEEPEIIEETSNFSVSKTGPQCVERVSPANQAKFVITVTNSDDSSEDILQVKDKLPLGFTYVEGSAIINGTADTVDQYLTVNTIGSTQELVWSTADGWSVAAGDTMTIEFTTLAGSNALTGEALNEVIVTPLNTPVDSNSLRTEFTVNVAQSCTTPVTAITDYLPVKILIGIVTVILAIFFYMTNSGNIVAENLAGSRAARKIELFGLKLTNPREYFEEKFRRRD